MSGIAVFALVIALSSSGSSDSWGSSISKAQAGRATKNIQILVSTDLKKLESAKSERTLNEEKLQSDGIQALNSLKNTYEQAKVKNSADLLSLENKLNSVAKVKVLVNNIS